MVKFKKINGFTLIELIIVMAITAILMLGIAAFFKPVNSLFINTDVLDTQRTVAEGINTYVCESVRYAKDLWIYPNYNSVPSTADFKTAVGAGDEDIRILSVLNNATDILDSETFKGRIKIKKNGIEYLALGKYYYGKYSYKFDLSDSNTSKISIKTTVLNKDSSSALKTSDSCKLVNSSMGGSFICQNPGSGENYYILYTLPD